MTCPILSTDVATYVSSGIEQRGGNLPDKKRVARVKEFLF